MIDVIISGFWIFSIRFINKRHNSSWNLFDWDVFLSEYRFSIIYGRKSPRKGGDAAFIFTSSVREHYDWWCAPKKFHPLVQLIFSWRNVLHCSPYSKDSNKRLSRDFHWFFPLLYIEIHHYFLLLTCEIYRINYFVFVPYQGTISCSPIKTFALSSSKIVLGE